MLFRSGALYNGVCNICQNHFRKSSGEEWEEWYEIETNKYTIQNIIDTLEQNTWKQIIGFDSEEDQAEYYEYRKESYTLSMTKQYNNTQITLVGKKQFLEEVLNQTKKT